MRVSPGARRNHQPHDGREPLRAAGVRGRSGGPGHRGGLVLSDLISVGIGYTLQVIGQKHSKASHAAIIMSLESVFAVIWGGIFLGERMSSLQLCGMVFMLSGMIVSQQKNTKNNS